MSLRVLMLGWELPPFNSGGLGEACFGLARALSKKGVQITFVLPKKLDVHMDFADLIFADVDEVAGNLAGAYTTNDSWSSLFPTNAFPPAQDYIGGALKFAEKMGLLAKRYKGSIDVVHAHDWLTYPAGMVAKRVLNKPLIAHVHATEFDRTGGHNPNPMVYAIEKKGFEIADKVLPVGGFMKDVLIEKYNVDQDKIQVVYNGIDDCRRDLAPVLTAFKELGYKVVLFLGRITLQKGPEYFVRAAKRILDYESKTIFVVTGSGDMEGYMISEAARLGILDKFIFTGFLRGEERDQIYQAADLYVMPSVSEPFGITALEALVNKTPLLISKQSGVSEILKNALKVDFWDIEEMANKAVAVLKYAALKSDLQSEGQKEVRLYNWSRTADEVINVYNQVTH